MPPKAKKAPVKVRRKGTKTDLTYNKRPKDGTLRPQDQKFCDACARGMPACTAYVKFIARGCTMATAMVEASKLLHRPEIALRIKNSRLNTAQTLEKHHGIRRETIATTLVEIIYTPVGELTRKHPLATKIKPTREGVQIEGPNKIEAIKELNRLTGFVKDQTPQNASVSDEVRSAFKDIFSRERPPA